MNKEEVWSILESCILAYEDCSIIEIRSYGFTEQQARIGIKLSNYLKDLELNEDETNNRTRINAENKNLS